MTAIKHDSNKPDHSLIPKSFLDQVAMVMQYGEGKYGRYNYKEGFTYSRLLGACSRHLSAFNDGCDLDAETGISHLGHAASCLLMLIDTIELGTAIDNRYKREAK